MLNHYFTLSALKDEFSRFFAGQRIVQIYSQQRNVLTVVFSSENSEESALVISIDPKLNYVFRQQRHARARKNSVDLFPDLVGASLKAIDIVPYERILHLVCSGDRILSLHLFQTAASNIYLIDSTRRVIEAFKHNSGAKGTILTPEARSFDERIVSEPDVFTAGILGSSDRSVSASLRHLMPFLGKIYAEEVCVRAGIEPGSSPRGLAAKIAGNLAAASSALLREADHPHPALHKTAEGVFLSVTRLKSQPEWPSESFPTFNDAVGSAVSWWHRKERRDEQEGSLLESLAKERTRVARARTAAEREASNADRASEYELFGNLIVAHLSTLTKGMKKAEVDNLLDDGSPVSITLDPQLTPAKNADRYFQKAREARCTLQESTRRAEELRKREELLVHLSDELESISSPEEFKEFLRQHEQELRGMKLLPAEAGKEQIPFRVFTVAGGLEVWVGKSSANNDLLTTRYSTPHDVWFHVRGASGSHTVLKVRGREAPPKESIRAAAAIAAYYSKMRNARNVPVAYCERKYVRKPRGAAPGSVLLEREEILFVNPSLP